MRSLSFKVGGRRIWVQRARDKQDPLVIRYEWFVGSYIFFAKGERLQAKPPRFRTTLHRPFSDPTEAAYATTSTRKVGFAAVFGASLGRRCRTRGLEPNLRGEEMTTLQRKREKGVIESYFYGPEDHGILTCQLMLKFEGGGGQGFGGLALNEELGPDYVQDLCDAFDVRDPERLKGMECYALRCWDWGTIEGVESVDTGKRFTHYDWRKKHWPDTKTPLEERKESLVNQAASLQRRYNEICDKDIPDVAKGYTDWSAT